VIEKFRKFNISLKTNFGITLGILPKTPYLPNISKKNYTEECNEQEYTNQ